VNLGVRFPSFRGVKVTAFPVEHADGNPAFGYRVDWNGHSVVLSGDTTLNAGKLSHVSAFAGPPCS
jgi:hypothetical protein